jgi:RNA polymerase sigma factor (sigma-70 family)
VPSLSTYLREVDRYPVLTKDDEARLSNTIARGRHAAVQLSQDKASNLEGRRLRRAVFEGRKAQTQFIESNLRLVVSVAKRHRYIGLPLEDLIGHGNVGLFRAIDKFDWRRGYRFSTYAKWWVRDAIKRGAQRDRETVHVSTHVTETVNQIGRTSGYLEADLGRTPTDEELARSLAMSVSRLRELRAYRVRPVTFSEPIPGAELSIEQTKPDMGSASMFDDMLRAISMPSIARLLTVLDSRERMVVSLRFGLDGNRPHTLVEIGRQIGLSRERARQIEAQALSKLRHPGVASDDCRELLPG